MKKILIAKKRILGCVIILVIIVISIFVVRDTNSEIVYSNTIYFAFGSIRLKIYDNGIVEEDKEIEDPNHTPDFKQIKKLTNLELNELKTELEKLDKKELDKFVNKLIYGKETPGNMGF